MQNFRRHFRRYLCCLGGAGAAGAAGGAAGAWAGGAASTRGRSMHSVGRGASSRSLGSKQLTDVSHV